MPPGESRAASLKHHGFSNLSLLPKAHSSSCITSSPIPSIEPFLAEQEHALKTLESRLEDVRFWFVSDVRLDDRDATTRLCSAIADARRSLPASNSLGREGMSENKANNSSSIRRGQEKGNASDSYSSAATSSTDSVTVSQHLAAIVLCGRFLSATSTKGSNTNSNQTDALPEHFDRFIEDLVDAWSGAGHLLRIILVPSADDPLGDVMLPRRPLCPYLPASSSDRNRDSSNDNVFSDGQQQEHDDEVPRSLLTTRQQQLLERANLRVILASNPCRLVYCSQDIVIYRDDLTSRMQRHCIVASNTGRNPLLPSSQADDASIDASLESSDTASQPSSGSSSSTSSGSSSTSSGDSEVADSRYEVHLAMSIINQASLSPLSCMVKPIIWPAFEAIRLVPAPSVLVLADVCEPYVVKHYDSVCLNPGSWSAANQWTYAVYSPAHQKAYFERAL